MPPEAFAESGAASLPSPGTAARYDPRCWDAYSLGVLLWECWHCEAPWDGRSFHQVITRRFAAKCTLEFRLKFAFV
jgi:hypothetical protein